MTNEEQFWSKVDRSEECWLWRGGRLPTGYGRLLYQGHFVYAHRLAWTLTNGPIPEGMFICHHCDNPPCCRPDHLYAGTSADNIADRERRQRSRWFTQRENALRHLAEMRVRGQQAKLTEADVLAIRACAATGQPHKVLADRYGVGREQIGRIVRGQRWRHLLMTEVS